LGFAIELDQFVPERQIVGSHFSGIPEEQVHTVLPAEPLNVGVNVSVELLMLMFARCGDVFEYVVVMTPPTTSSISTNLPVIEIGPAKPADVLLEGG